MFKSKIYTADECAWRDDPITRKYCDYEHGQTVLLEHPFQGDWICMVKIQYRPYEGVKYIELQKVMQKETFIEAFNKWVKI